MIIKLFISIHSHYILKQIAHFSYLYFNRAKPYILVLFQFSLLILVSFHLFIPLHFFINSQGVNGKLSSTIFERQEHQNAFSFPSLVAKKGQENRKRKPSFQFYVSQCFESFINVCAFLIHIFLHFLSNPISQNFKWLKIEREKKNKKENRLRYILAQIIYIDLCFGLFLLSL